MREQSARLDAGQACLIQIKPDAVEHFLGTDILAAQESHQNDAHHNERPQSQLGRPVRPELRAE
jgi:hypothetical protein